MFGFLFDVKSLELSNRETIGKFCSNLQLKLSDGPDSDICGANLSDELMTLNVSLPSKMKPIDVLNHIVSHGYGELYPNTCIALPILLTTPVTVASGERSFSKLKLSKTYLRLDDVPRATTKPVDDCHRKHRDIKINI